MSKVMVETPVLIFAPLLYTIIVYFGIGLTVTASKFFIFYAILALIVLASASFGYLISSIFNNMESAVAVGPIIMMPIILFGGVFTNVSSYAKWISWVQYLSPIRYGLEALVRNEFEGDVFAPPVTNPIDRLEFDFGWGVCIGVLVALTAGLRIISMIALRLLVSKF